jgi:two-component system, cell cycle sensor histidine kinase and response regulator CckA
LGSDTGHDMTPEVKGRLFEPFFTTKPTTQNTGLGLATVYGIVVQSGGYIWVDSEPEKGTTFKICFPRVEVEDQITLPIVRPAPPARGSETILLVEDEPAVRNVAIRVLMNQGYFVLAASSGEEALALAEKVGGAIDLILTDVVMPDLGGPELVAQLLERWPGISTVYMSGYAEGDKARVGIQESSTSFLQKPFSASSLTVTVREVLDQESNRPPGPPSGPGSAV